jgi:hypothetical protein
VPYRARATLVPRVGTMSFAVRARLTWHTLSAEGKDD